jgi:hypothetical protein
MPSPSTIDAGSVLVSVTVTVPDADATNVRSATPPFAITAFNVCVPGPGAGVVGAVAVAESLLPPHAAHNMHNRASPGKEAFM